MYPDNVSTIAIFLALSKLSSCSEQKFNMYKLKYMADLNIVISFINGEFKYRPILFYVPLHSVYSPLSCLSLPYCWSGNWSVFSENYVWLVKFLWECSGVKCMPTISKRNKSFMLDSMVFILNSEVSRPASWGHLCFLYSEPTARRVRLCKCESDSEQ